MRIYISGSLAYDRIMSFPGKFSDHILADKVHMINVSLVVDGISEKFGGTAGNIAFNLALLGEHPQILATAGKDFSSYEKWLRKMELPLDGIRPIDNELTGGAYIMTDKDNNQITSFNPGAMKYSCGKPIDRSNIGGSYGIVSPGNVDDMVGYPRTYKQLNIPYIFDPGQQIPALSPEQMQEAVTGAFLLVTNDYELEMIIKKTGLTKAQLIERTGGLITTLGENGSQICELGHTRSIEAVPVADVNDPTGAGDAFRAGLLKGLIEKRSVDDCCRIGSTCASYCVEKHGTQEHSFTLDGFWKRYRDRYGEPPAV